MAGEQGRSVGKLRDRLFSMQRIGLDTAIFIYHLEANERYLPLTKALFNLVQAGEALAVTSTVTLMEVTVRPWQLGQEAVARQYETLLTNFPNLRIVDFDRTISRRAAQLRACYRVRPADAIQLATAIISEADVFVSNDLALGRVQPEIEIVLLEEFAS